MKCKLKKYEFLRKVFNRINFKIKKSNLYKKINIYRKMPKIYLARKN